MSGSQLYNLYDPSGETSLHGECTLEEIQALLDCCQIDSTWKAARSGVSERVSLDKVKGLDLTYSIAIICHCSDILDEEHRNIVNQRIEALEKIGLKCRKVVRGQQLGAMLQSAGQSIHGVEQILSEITLSGPPICLQDAKYVVASHSPASTNDPEICAALDYYCRRDHDTENRIPLLPVNWKSRRTNASEKDLDGADFPTEFREVVNLPPRTKEERTQVEKIKNVLGRGVPVPPPWKAVLAVLVVCVAVLVAVFLPPGTSTPQPPPEQVAMATLMEELDRTPTPAFNQNAQSTINSKLGEFPPGKLSGILESASTAVQELESDSGKKDIVVLLFEKNSIIFCYRDGSGNGKMESFNSDELKLWLQPPNGTSLVDIERNSRNRIIELWKVHCKKFNSRMPDLRERKYVIVCGTVPEVVVGASGNPSSTNVHFDGTFWDDLSQKLSVLSPTPGDRKRLEELAFFSGSLQGLIGEFDGARCEWNPKWNAKWAQVHESKE